MEYVAVCGAVILRVHGFSSVIIVLIACQSYVISMT